MSQRPAQLAAFVAPALPASSSGWRSAAKPTSPAPSASSGNSVASGVRLSPQALTLVAASSLAVWQRRRGRRRRAAAVARASMTGPGWTDEVARLFCSNERGPEYKDLGYRGRPRIRLLLDGEELAHSYAKAAYERTGKFTGPLSIGIEKALMYGGWRGGVAEDPDRDEDLDMPEIMTFVAMPADLIEAINPSALVDGYPEELRQKVGRVLTGPGMEGYSINEWIRTLQEQNRLITWHRKATQNVEGSTYWRPNTLLRQKYWESGETIPVGEYQSKNYAAKGVTKLPTILSQVMGAGVTINVGERVEALKQGFVNEGKWLPSKWTKGTVVACNYDGSYDIEFDEIKGVPYQYAPKFGLTYKPTLPKHNLRYFGMGADQLPAFMRYMQEMNFQMSTPAEHVRRAGHSESIGETLDFEGSQDWYLCSSKKFVPVYDGIEAKANNRRVQDFTAQFQFSYEWVNTKEGLQFKPVPSVGQEIALRTSHKDVAMEYAGGRGLEVMDKYKQMLTKVKLQMDRYVGDIGNLPRVLADRPTMPAGPRTRERGYRLAKMGTPEIPAEWLPREMRPELGPTHYRGRRLKSFTKIRPDNDTIYEGYTQKKINWDKNQNLGGQKGGAFHPDDTMIHKLPEKYGNKAG